MLNRIELGGVLVERQVQRFTPAGVAVVEGLVRHQSEQVEAGSPRRVECEVRVIALAAAAQLLQAAMPGAELMLTGFLAARSRSGKQLRMHVTKIEFVEGKQDGTILQEEG